jgi:Putative prokaryotic signal transducing protein
VIELLRTNDLVLISYVRALLAGERIEAVVLDEHASVMDGTIAAIRRRIMVDDNDIERARQLLVDADLGHVFKN